MAAPWSCPYPLASPAAGAPPPPPPPGGVRQAPSPRLRLRLAPSLRSGNSPGPLASPAAAARPSIGQRLAAGGRDARRVRDVHPLAGEAHEGDVVGRHAAHRRLPGQEGPPPNAGRALGPP